MPVEYVWALSDMRVLRTFIDIADATKRIVITKTRRWWLCSSNSRCDEVQRMMSSRIGNAGSTQANALKHIWLE